MNPQAVLDYLVTSGLIVSLVYGKAAEKGICWSVDVLNEDEEFFEKPYQAFSFEDAVAIAYLECAARGWCKTNDNLNVYNPLDRPVVINS